MLKVTRVGFIAPVDVPGIPISSNYNGCSPVWKGTTLSFDPETGVLHGKTAAGILFCVPMNNCSVIVVEKEPNASKEPKKTRT